MLLCFVSGHGRTVGLIETVQRNRRSARSQWSPTFGSWSPTPWMLDKRFNAVPWAHEGVAYMGASSSC